MANRLLIAAGTAKYDHLDKTLQRPQLAQIVESLAGMFTDKLRYTRVLSEISLNPTSSEFISHLDTWFGSTERDATDWIAVYYTAHADLDGQQLNLYTADTKDGKTASTTISASQLANVLVGRAPKGEKRRVRNCLLILDTCFAAEGAFSFVSRLKSYFEEGGPGEFYVIAAALPRETARAGALAKALMAAIDAESLGGPQQQWLSFEELKAYVNSRLEPDTVFFATFGGGPERAQFFPNPRYIQGLPQNMTVAELRRVAYDADVQSFWLRASRGIEFEPQEGWYSKEGWYFTGRKRLLSELASWLADSGDPAPRIVTGPPGSGKSALIGYQILLADPQFHSLVSSIHDGNAPAPEAYRIDVAVYAKGKTYDEIVVRFANHLKVDPNETAVLGALASRTTLSRIVIDAVDESPEADRIARQLLRPICDFKNVRLLVGTRREYVSDLAPAVKIIDLGDSNYLDQEDVAEYVASRLLRSNEKQTISPYQSIPDLARRIGAEVARRAGANFLIARLVVEDLVAQDHVISEQELAGRQFPDSVGLAFEGFFARFGSDEHKVRDLLAPLAWSPGRGLPRSLIWPTISSALAERTYSEDDVRWSLEKAASYVVQALEDDRTVYRLYHQALADYLRRDKDPDQIQGRISRALESLVPLASNSRTRDWRAAHPYIRTYFAQISGAAKLLGAYLLEPLFLLGAEPSSVLSALQKWRDDIPLDLRDAYDAWVPLLRKSRADEAPGYLQLVAHQTAHRKIAEEASQLGLKQSWSVPWANWTPAMHGSRLAPGEAQIRVLETVDWVSNHPAALVGREDGEVEVWDLGTGDPVARWAPLDRGTLVDALALAKTPSGTLLLAAWRSGHLGANSIQTAQHWLRRDEHSASAICVTTRDGEPVCITAHRDRRIVIRSLPNLEPLFERSAAVPARACAMRIVRHQGRDALLVATDYFVKGDDTGRGTLFLLGLADLRLLWEGRDSIDGIPERVSIPSISGRNLAVVCDPNRRASSVWDLDLLKRVYQSPEEGELAWLHERDGGLWFIASVPGSGTMSMRQLVPAAHAPGMLVESAATPTSLDVSGKRLESLVTINARPAFITLARHSLYIWDLRDLLLRPTPDPTAQLKVAAMTTHPRYPEQLYVGTTDGEVLMLETATGQIRWSTTVSSGTVHSLAADPFRGVLIVANKVGRLQVLDLDKRALSGSQPTDRKIIQIRHVAVVSLQGQSVAAATVQDKSGWALRFWDLASGNEIETVKRYGLRFGEEDKGLTALAASLDGDRVQVAFASRYSKVMVADLGNGLRPPSSDDGIFPDREPFEEWHIGGGTNEYVDSVCFGVMTGRRVLAAGTRGGQLKLWDASSGEAIALNDHAHQYSIVSLAFLRIADFDMLVSASDGVLRFWSTHLLLLDEIDIGEPITQVMPVNSSDIAIGTMRGVLLIRPRAALGEGPPGSKWKLPYQVIVHDPLTGRDSREGFESLEAAFSACENVVDAEMNRLRKVELSPREWVDQYRIFGLAPHIVGNRGEERQFSAVEYAKEKSSEASGP